MENNNIKVHPPWYARGTPVVNPRDGPPMALSDNALFAVGVIFNDADRACPDVSGSWDAVRSEEHSAFKRSAVVSVELAVDFDSDKSGQALSAYAVSRRIGTGSDNVKMDEERSAVYFEKMK